MRWLELFLFVLCLPLVPALYLVERFYAAACPRCGDDWDTGFVGYRCGGEEWWCPRCRHKWIDPYSHEG